MPGKNVLGYEPVRVTPELTALRQLVIKLTAHVAALSAQKPIEAKGEDTDSDTFEVVQRERLTDLGASLAPPAPTTMSRKDSDADSEDYCQASLSHKGDSPSSIDPDDEYELFDIHSDIPHVISS
jgi:hypothetical protein